MKNNIFIYQGYEIPKGFILKLKYKKKLTAYVIDRLIFRAVHYAEWIRQEKGVKVPLINIMSKGISKGWLFNETPTEEYNKPYLLGWIDAEIYGRKKKKVKPTGEFVAFIDRTKLPDSIGDILKELI